MVSSNLYDCTYKTLYLTHKRYYGLFIMNKRTCSGDLNQYRAKLNRLTINHFSPKNGKIYCECIE